MPDPNECARCGRSFHCASCFAEHRTLATKECRSLRSLRRAFVQLPDGKWQRRPR